MQDINSIFGAAFQRLIELAQEKQATKTNRQRFEESGVMNLTEDKNGVFVWLPDSCEQNQQLSV